jgi:P pilus assembly chaperone PapD
MQAILQGYKPYPLSPFPRTTGLALSTHTTATARAMTITPTNPFMPSLEQQTSISINNLVTEKPVAAIHKVLNGFSEVQLV